MGTARVNWFIVEHADGLVLVDAGLPGHLTQLQSWLGERRREPGDIAAVLLTHGHADHLGFAQVLSERGVPVWLHAADVPIAGERGIDLPPPRLRRNLWRPSGLGMLTEFLRGGITATRGLTAPHTFGDDEILPVPGGPVAIALPGHTPGSAAFHFPDAGAVFTGDALMTMDPMKGGVGPTVFATRRADDPRTIEALARLADPHRTDDVRRAALYPGHGDPWLAAGAVGVAAAAARLP